MKYKIVELEEFQGLKSTVYSVILEDEHISLFDHFLNENMAKYQSELKNIVSRILQISKTTGARETYFKTNEGKPGDGVCALYDDPDNKLRLYCIRYGNIAVLLGGGGPKLFGISAWQEDEKLSKEANIMIQISNDIMKRISAREIQWSKDGMKLTGNLQINDDED